jgi:hypothetical protein
MVSGTDGMFLAPASYEAGAVGAMVSGSSREVLFDLINQGSGKAEYLQLTNATDEFKTQIVSNPVSGGFVIQTTDYSSTRQPFYASGGRQHSNFGKKGGRASIFGTTWDKGGPFHEHTSGKTMAGLHVGSGAATNVWNLGVGKGLWLHDNDDDVSEFWKNNGGTKMLALGSGSYDVIVPGTLNVVGNLYQNGSQITPGGGGGGGAPTDAQYVTLATDGDLSAERVLTAGSDIDLADGGANSTVTINLESELNTPTGIYNSSLKVGRDAHNLVDFSTDDEINFRAANADQMKVTDGTLEPETNNDIALGTATKGFSQVRVADGGAYYIAASGGITQDIQICTNVDVVMNPMTGAIEGVNPSYATLQIKGGIIVRYTEL